MAMADLKSRNQWGARSNTRPCVAAKARTRRVALANLAPLPPALGDLERCLFGPSRSGPASERPRSQVQGLAGLRSISAVLPTAWNCPPTAPAAAPLSCSSLRSRPVSFVHSVQCRRAVLHTPKLSLRDPPSRGRRLPFIPFHVALAGATSCLAPRRAPSSLSFFVDSFSASPPTNQPTAPTAPPPVAPPDRDDSLTFPPRSFCFCVLCVLIIPRSFTGTLAQFRRRPPRRPRSSTTTTRPRVAAATSRVSAEQAANLVRPSFISLRPTAAPPSSPSQPPAPRRPR